MRKYLSFGGGVNSVAMMLMLLDQKDDFEAIFVDHGTDWPETYEYFDIFQEWLRNNGHEQITVLKPNIQGFDNLYNYYFSKKKTPSIMQRDCTDKFKLRPIYKYVEKPCFMLLGIDNGESHRARINVKKGVENRFPLIEHEIDRDGCKDIIRRSGLQVPIKSGCYTCPFQKVGQWKELRTKHPDLFCKVQALENAVIDYRIENGKKPFTINSNGKRLKTIIDEDQMNLFEQDDYPPCQCGL